MTRKVFYLRTIISFSILAIIGTAFCQAKIEKLTYQQAFESGRPQLLAALPQIEAWLDDDFYLHWHPVDKSEKNILVKTNARSGDESDYLDFTAVKAQLNLPASEPAWVAKSADYRKYILEKENDLYYYLPATETLRKITDNPEPEKNPQFSADDKKISFTRENNLFIIDLESGHETQITSDGTDLISNGWASWVYFEEIFGRSSKYQAFWWSPDSKMIAFMRFDDSQVPTFPIFHCEGPHGYLEIQRYPKAGDINPQVKLGIYHLEKDEIIWIEADDNPDHYLAWPLWTPDSKHLLFQWMNRDQDELHLLKADPLTGKWEQIYQENRRTWVEFFEDIFIIKKDNSILIRSDKNGWRHLYHYDLQGKFIGQITDGQWNVDEISALDEENGWIYFLASKDKSVNRIFYKTRLDGSYLLKLSSAEGVHKVQASPAVTLFIDSYSTIDHPTKTDLINGEGKKIRTLGDRKTAALENTQLGRTEIFSIRTDDGIDLPALWVLPADFDKTKKYPLIFQVYGGPGRASVQNAFRPLSDHFYARHGIIVMAVDHRGSSHFGKQGADKMHRVLGKWETEDLISAVKWLRTQPFIDTKKIGITGGSYGGYMVCMALTYGADYISHGIAKYSVTDWRFYDSIYTERYMDRPEENIAGYEFGSVMTHAGKYKGKMLITHGVLDDNVHMQNTIELIEDLQRLGKHFEVMVYPNQRHGIRGAWRPHAIKLDIDFWFRHFLNRPFDFNE